MIKSISYDQNEILQSIISLHSPEGFDCDPTYGNGRFYAEIPQPKHKFDIDPQLPEVIQADSQCLPLEPKSINSIIIDPPFLTYVKQGRSHNNGSSIMASRFGGYYTYDDLIEHYQGTISEAHRILSKKGIMTFKCQDIIHNHRIHSTHTNVIHMAELEGFRLLDMFILAAKHRMPTRKGKQRHARIYHSYFLVFKKL